ncbi:unnamed protein product [Boreogadus saida]
MLGLCKLGYPKFEAVGLKLLLKQLSDGEATANNICDPVYSWDSQAFIFQNGEPLAMTRDSAVSLLKLSDYYQRLLTYMQTYSNMQTER